MKISFRTSGKQRVVKAIAAFLALNILAEVTAPTAAWALTSGPSQPEVQSFEPVGTTDMVDLFTGDFNYNIPLFELPGPNGGYPFNIAYHSGISMDQEASWVGLGWNLNPGAITREMRGMPDDFKGDNIKKKLDMKDHHTVGVGFSMDVELLGADMNKLINLSQWSLGAKVYYNNFKGIGYSLEPGIDFAFKKNNWGMGFNFSLDSQEGVGMDASVNWKDKNEKEYNKYNLGIGFNSKRGLDLSLSASRTSDDKGITDKKGNALVRGAGGGSTYSFAEKAYTPIVSSSTISSNLGVSIKQGISTGPAFYNLAYQGFYSIEHLDNKAQEQVFNGYGYNYQEDMTTDEKKQVGDFNREKDGMIRKNSPNLAIPNMTYDYYNIAGQGVAGMFRPYRSEIGHIEDPYVRSWGAGGSFGLEFGAGAASNHFGGAIHLNFSTSSSQSWENNHNRWQDAYKFKDRSKFSNLDYEDVYYKVHGEYTSYDPSEKDYIGGDEAVRALFTKEGTFLGWKYNPKDDEFYSASQLFKPNSSVRDRSLKSRMPRNSSVQPITNELLLSGSQELLKEYDIKYFSTPNAYTGTGTDISRTRPLHHTAGISVVNPDGNRYVYGLPAYNEKKVESVFTCGELTGYDECGPRVTLVPGQEPAYEIANTEEYFNRTEMDPYAHSYMLTSILGTDYVDVTGNGISDDDYGYWVKFNYVKTASNYKWRAPFKGANYDRGYISSTADNKASFTYGEREEWHIATAETKTHIAVFKISPRKDGRDAYQEYNDGNTIIGSNYSYKLDEIALYAKTEWAKYVADNSYSPVPIKKVHFEYTYDLCGNAENNDGTLANVLVDGRDQNVNKGKLTLKKLWFTYQNNDRGSLSPYVFNYNERQTASPYNIDHTNNPDYALTQYDRWGNYKSGGTYCDNLNFPYVKQFNPSTSVTESKATKQAFRNQADIDAAVWSMRSITLPTGGVINIDYEADDYGYVQHKKATQMFQVLSFSSGWNDQIYSKSTWDKNPSTNAGLRRIYVKLENPIIKDPGNNYANIANAKFRNQYMEGLRQSDGNYQMYFKMKVKLRQPTEGVTDFVSGYVNLEDGSGTYGVDPNSLATIDGNQCYTIGFVTVKPNDLNNNTEKYHPFAVAAWQHLRTNQPDLMFATGNITTASSGSASVKAMKAKSLGAIIPYVQQVFTGYRDYAYNREWGCKVDLSNTWIRLTTPDEMKIGGGLRVKKISFSDKWAAATGTESDSEYGQVYDYTSQVKDNSYTTPITETVSNGVAQYEPLIGGDEIALRYAKNYVEKIPVFTDNSLFFEYPVNESYFPAPVVGYSKVTVRSLASYRQTLPANDPSYLPPGVSTTGISVHEFYTAREFPVIWNETDCEKKPFDLYIPIPLIGQIVTHDMTAAQGYVVELNDMHGKLKSVTYYGQDKNGVLLTTPESSIRYNYKFKWATLIDGTTVKQLDNQVTVLKGEQMNTNNDTYECSKSTAIMGEEYEFFTDQRKSRSFSVNAGLDWNIDQIGPFPIPCPWPTFGSATYDTRTAVTNKIIHKTGILISTEAYDGQSKVITENKLFDSQTGRPLLTTVTNDFDQPVYKYEYPAMWAYDGMGAAYKNFGMYFHAKILSYDATTQTFTLKDDYNQPVDQQSPSKNLSYVHTQNSAMYPYPITMADLSGWLSEGDEFVIDKANGTAKYKATLISKSSYCTASGTTYQLKFHVDAASPTGIGSNDEFRFDIVRSGRRNLLMADAGSIIALQDPTLNANRGSIALSPVSYTNTSLAPELAVFLNSIIDCNGQLPLQTYDLSSGQFYGADGLPLFPTLSSLFSSFTIGLCTDANGECTTCNSTNVGYHIIYNLKDGCTSGTCHCIARRTTSGANDVITSFSYAGTNQITVNYTTSPVQSTYCVSCFNFNYTPKLTRIKDVLNASAVQFRDYWDYDQQASACPASSAQYNLFAIGKKGIWRPFTDNYYKDARYKNTSSSAGLEIKHDGVFGTLSDFWFYPYNWRSSAKYPIPSQWIPNNTITKYNENGYEIETKDITGIYSTALYGYNGSLSVAVASNAKQNEIYYDCVDDPSAKSNTTTWTSPNAIEPAFGHTGKKSIKIAANTANTLSITNKLSLTNNKPYLVSLWIGRIGSLLPTYKDVNLANSAAVDVKCYDKNGTQVGATVTLYPTGNIIDGWQKIEGEFTSAAAGVVRVDIVLKNGGVTSYFDDIRIFPKDGNIKTYSYDPGNYRLQAILDDNNYATIYSYDEQGNLFLVKKETVAGIKTIQESRSHQKE